MVTESGRGLFPDSYVEPVATLERSGPTRWARPAAYGWMRGLSAAGSTENGLVQLPADAGAFSAHDLTIRRDC